MSFNFDEIVAESNRIINTALNPEIGSGDSDGRDRLAFQQRLFYNVALGSMWCMPRFLGWQPPQISIGAMVSDIKQCNNPAVSKALPLVEKAFQTSIFYDAVNQLKPNEQHRKNDLINTHASGLKQSASALSHEDQLPLPIGTYTHAMFLQAKCTIVNGVRRYQVKVYDSASQWAPFGKVPTMVIEDIHPDAIEKSSFLNVLLWLKTLPNSSTHQVHGAIHHYLIQEGGGRVIKDANPALRHHPQGPLSEDCASKCLNYWLQETVGKAAWRNFKVVHTEMALARIRQTQAYEETYVGKRWFVNPHFLNRILYFLFNFIPISAQLTLAEGVLEKRRRKAQALNRAGT